MFYVVSFQYSQNIYCTNIAHGDLDKIEKAYSKYAWHEIREANGNDLENAKRRKTPVIYV